MYSKTLKIAKVFQKIAQQQSAQPADIEKALHAHGLMPWAPGSDPRSPTLDLNGKLANNFFKLLDKYQSDAVTATLLVSPDGSTNVNVSVQGGDSRGMEAAVKKIYEPLISKVLRKTQTLPAETVKIQTKGPWINFKY